MTPHSNTTSVAPSLVFEHVIVPALKPAVRHSNDQLLELERRLHAATPGDTRPGLADLGLTRSVAEQLIHQLHADSFMEPPHTLDGLPPDVMNKINAVVDQRS